jgi:hypothetical protein
MSRVYFAKGARGDLIRKLQQRLTARGFDTKGVDGVYGKDTEAAVSAFQQTTNLPVTNGVDEVTWQSVMDAAIPSVRDRSLQLTAAFENHGFTLAQGNFDGAGITWGIIGFTLKHGEITKICSDIFERRPELMRDAFGDNLQELLVKLKAPLEEQLDWADSLSLGASKETLAEPWRSAFRRFGEMDEVQRVQLAVADRDYFQPALATVGKFGLKTELGLSLAFDIHVQNGGVKQSARAQIENEIKQNPPSDERDLRIIIANAVADQSTRSREDVRSRKLAIATGAGEVHGMVVQLQNWGLDEVDLQPLTLAETG